MEQGVAYLAPFVMNPEKWNKKQIERFEGGHTFFLALAGLGFPSGEYINLHRKLSKRDGTWPLIVEMILDTR